MVAIKCHALFMADISFDPCTLFYMLSVSILLPIKDNVTLRPTLTLMQTSLLGSPLDNACQSSSWSTTSQHELQFNFKSCDEVRRIRAPNTSSVGLLALSRCHPIAVAPLRRVLLVGNRRHDATNQLSVWSHMHNLTCAEQSGQPCLRCGQLGLECSLSAEISYSGSAPPEDKRVNKGDANDKIARLERVVEDLAKRLNFAEAGMYNYEVYVLLLCRAHSISL